MTFAGYVEQDIIKSAMCGCDLYLFPTLEETEGIPIIEACASKTPALIRDISVFDDWLIDGKNVYKARSIESFQKNIEEILNGKKRSLVDAAYDVAKKRDIVQIGKELKKVYEYVLQK